MEGSRRLHDLEERFRELETRIPEGAEKEAISVLHGTEVDDGGSSAPPPGPEM